MISHKDAFEVPDTVDHTGTVRTENVLNRVILIFSILTGVGLIATALLYERKLGSLLIILALLITIITAKFLAKLDQTRKACVFAVTGIWLIFAFIVFMGGGLNNINVVFFVSMTVVSGLLLGERATRVVAGAGIIMGLGLALMDTFGYLPNRYFVSTPFGNWSELVFALVLTAGALNLALRERSNALNTAKKQLSDRIAAESALRESEELYHRLIAAIPDLVVRTDIDGEIQFVNEMILQVSGYKRSELIGKNMISFVDPEDRERVYRNTLLMMERPLGPRQYRLVMKDGKKRIFEANGDVLRAKNGVPYGIVNVLRDITDRTIAAAERLRDEKDLRESQRIAHLGSWRLNLETNEVYWTEELYEMYGFDPTLPPPTYTEHMKLFTPESWELLSTSLQQTRDTGIPYELELEMVRADGRKGWMWVRGEAVKDSQGKTVGLWGAAQDITERKLQEEEHLHFFKSMEHIDRVIRKETDVEEMLRGIIDRVFSIFQCDRAWLLYPCDPDAEIFTVPMEKSRPEYPGAFAQGMAVPLPQTTAQDFRDALENDGPIRFGPEEKKSVNADIRDQFSVKSQMFMAIYPKIGKPWVFGMHQCAYARKWTDAESVLFNEIGRRISDGLSSLLFFRDLKESEEKFRTITASAKDAIIMIDNAGSITYWNRAAEIIFGYAAEAIMGRALHNVLAPPQSRGDYSRAFSVFRETGSGPVVGKTIELTAVRKDGMELNIELSISAVKLKDQWTAIGIIRDITARKKAEEERTRLQEQLNRAQRFEAVGVLAGGIAHDFNNLLMGIQGRASLMLTEKDASSPDYEHIKGIEDCVKSASDLTKQLLGFSRGGKYEVVPTDLNHLIEKSADMFGRTRKEIEIHKKYQERLWPVEVDRGQIEQVLLNLFVNAWQSMPGGGALYLQTENVTLRKDADGISAVSPGRYVKISVTDTGVGMDAKTRERIFEPFFTTKEMGRGTGLGLASVYGIVRSHNGMIDVQSEKGQGATFHIFLPASEKQVPKKTEIQGEITPGKETVLLVDDEAVILDVGKQMLKKLGYKVLLSQGGNEAVHLYETNREQIDLVILDMVMPKMSGGKTFDKLRKIDPDVKVLLSSGYSIDGEARDIMVRGCNGFIQKPFRLDDLSRKLRQILDRR